MSLKYSDISCKENKLEPLNMWYLLLVLSFVFLIQMQVKKYSMQYKQVYNTSDYYVFIYSESMLVPDNLSTYLM